MKKLFYLGIIVFVALEILGVYLIMPFPGSQRSNNVDIAFFFHSWRWVFRAVLSILILVSGIAVVKNSKLHLLAVLPLVLVAFLTNFQFAADRMFREPNEVIMKSAAESSIELDRQIVGVFKDGEARAYPIQFIAYHHKVQDKIAGEPILVTYCTVCRTGRVFAGSIGKETVTFRLVGMDRFNAMIEDSATRSWWRQANGEAVAGKLKGEKLTEFQSKQMTLAKWLDLYPQSLVMQPDPAFADQYQSYAEYENGKGGELTGRSLNSWEDKSWIVGITIKDASKAFDWNKLSQVRIINDSIGGVPVVLVLAEDRNSFFAFERSSNDDVFVMDNDQLVLGENRYDLLGLPVGHNSLPLKPVNAYQEFWHSWRTFHPDTFTDTE
ncbi:MAG: DUF3179 domain-containing protein [Acidobacteria bacterium]|nr:DUF3179 domain-containing protein [Acidobacteriota bacterium]